MLGMQFAHERRKMIDCVLFTFRTVLVDVSVGSPYQ